MGNLQSYCCKDSPVEADDEREEQSRIWSDDTNVCQQYGTCSQPNPPNIYKIVLPKLVPVDIESYDNIENRSVSLDNSSSASSSPSSSSTTTDKPTTPNILLNSPNEGASSPTSEANEKTPRGRKQRNKGPAVIKEEYFAEQFEQLRSYILKSADDQTRFRELLWSCIPWSAPGGKSGSTFLKTSNDQFILKEMSKLELNSFTSMADDYFKYIQDSYQNNKPSLLSTILGIYRIVYTKSASHSGSDYYFMVMRNLFYRRNITQTFDLKGSMRNRLVDTDDPDNTNSVLMDQNLLMITCDRPLFIRSTSKKILNEAIDNDSRFLTSVSVMDYSLLVGVDKENQELILGIIDYVRPFTWDKKIERVVKSVVGTELPTIIEPELYRERFCEAMDKYFENVPDDWS